MITGALSVLGLLFAAIGKLFDYLYAAKMVDAGHTQAQLESLRKQIEDAQIAVAAREAIRAAATHSPDGLPIDPSDPFLRD